MKSKELLTQVEQMIAKLQGNLNDEDRRLGWNDRSQAAMLNFFRQFAEDLSSGKDLSNCPHYGTVIRGLDHWGISDGELFNDAIVISNQFRKLIRD